MAYKLTIDSNLIDRTEIEGMQTLKKWKEEGRLDFTEANRAAEPKKVAYGWPGAPQKPVVSDNKPKWSTKARAGKIQDSGKATFNSVAAVCFPSKDPHKLSMMEVNDIVHLIKHHSNKNEIFVTANSKSFIENGRREKLKSAFGIIIMTPEETVRMLEELEGWVEKSDAAKKGAKLKEKS